MTLRILSGIFLAMSLFYTCKTQQKTSAPRPSESYTPEEEKPLVSVLTIPVNVSVEDLTRSLNAKIPAVLYEDYSYTDNYNDGLMLKAMKSRDVTLNFSTNAVKYRVPVKLWIKKDLVVTDAEAEGELALSFKTTYSINPDWTVKTTTEVEYHEWLSKPVLKTGLGNISIETLANLALNRSKKTLTQTLDRYVAQQLNLKPYVQEVWTAIQEPMLLDQDYKMWVKTTPISIGMSPVTSDWSHLKTKIAVECINDVTFGEKPTFRENSNLPDLKSVSESTSDDFKIRIATDVPFPEAERLAKMTMVGQEFTSGKKKVRVEDIQLWGNNDNVVVNTMLSGAFNGNIYFIGKPVMNVEKRQIEIQNLDYHVDTRSFLMRSASWMFQGPIKNQMAKAMVFPLDENIRELRQSVQETLTNYEIQPGITLQGTIDSVTVENTKVTPTSIRVNLFSQGRVSVDVKGL
ncbi:MAG: DUF4403 family protein [Saprospiraceae bacterium]|nr:DUF4403 family protein [Saprospiraceae bacterium]